MYFYCITFMRMYDDDNTEHKFFCYATTKQEAVKRFCVITGYKSTCIVSVHVESQGMEGEQNKWD